MSTKLSQYVRISLTVRARACSFNVICTYSFAFITLSSAQDVHNIVKDMNNTVADGRILLIRVAKKQKTSNSEGSGSSESDHSSSSGECVDSTTGIRTHNNYGIPRTTQPLNEIDYSTMPGLEPLDTCEYTTSQTSTSKRNLNTNSNADESKMN